MSIIITLKVTAGARKERIVKGELQDLHLYVRERAVEGKANKGVIAFLAAALSRKQSDITLKSGFTSRYKIIEIAGFSTKESLFEELGLVRQYDIFQVESD